MLRSIGAAFICLATLPALCQSSSKYQVATIADVKQHKIARGSASEAVSYDVALEVGGTIYTTLYTPPLGTETVKYAAGRQLLVLVGEKTIKYNDILGRSVEVPIISQNPAPAPEQVKK
jgi:hypothetical protein